MDYNYKIKKLLRYSRIYGISRALIKVIGRLRDKTNIAPLNIGYQNKKRTVSIIGCGQFAFSTICFFIKKNKGIIFLNCYDKEEGAASSLRNYYKFQAVAESSEQLLNEKKLKILYIASNHASHTKYALDAIKLGVRSVYIEKPISTTYNQLEELICAQRRHNVSLYAGYNRPYSKAIQILRQEIRAANIKNGKISLNFFISGHLISDNHWYRNEEEGTRICGNMGHWLDLTIHILNWRNEHHKLYLTVVQANKNEVDDNITINITTDSHDIISIMLTARTEPFEGINETVNIQYGDIIAKIDDFRKMTLWYNEKLMRKRFWPKDVGHKRAVLQPFYSNKENRAWEEVIISTLLMLYITDMVRSGIEKSIFDTKESLEKLYSDINLQTVI